MSKQESPSINTRQPSRQKRYMIMRKAKKQTRRHAQAARRAARDAAYVRRLKVLADRYVRLKLSVLPVYGIENGTCTCGKSGCDRPGKHARL